MTEFLSFKNSDSNHVFDIQTWYDTWHQQSEESSNKIIKEWGHAVTCENYDNPANDGHGTSKK